MSNCEAEARAQFDSIRSLIADAELNAAARIRQGSDPIDKDYEDIVFNGLIRLTYYPKEGLIQEDQRKLWQLTNENFELSRSRFNAFLAKDSSCAHLLDWLERSVRLRQLRRNEAYVYDDEFDDYADDDDDDDDEDYGDGDNSHIIRNYFGYFRTSADDFNYALTNMLIQLSADALATSNNMHSTHPAAFQLYQSEGLSDGSFGRLRDRCEATDVPNAGIAARAIQLFHLAHRAIELTYTDCWLQFERANERDTVPIPAGAVLINPWRDEHQNTLHSQRDSATVSRMASFHSASAIWLSKLAELREPLPIVKPAITEQHATTNQQPSGTEQPAATDAPISLKAVPNAVFANLSTYCRYVWQFAGKPNSGTRAAMLPIVQTMVTLCGTDQCNWHMRVELMEGLQLLLVRKQKPRLYWYELLEPHESEAFDWHQKIVPALMRLANDVRLANVDDPYDCEHKVPLYEIFMHVLNKCDQRQRARRANKLDSPEAPVWRAFVLDVLASASGLMDVLISAKRGTEFRVVAPIPAPHPNRSLWCLYTDNDFELRDNDFGRFCVHRLIETHVSVLRQVLDLAQELCRDTLIAQQVATLLSGLLSCWLETAGDQLMVRSSRRLTRIMPLLGCMMSAMTGNEVFVEWYAQDAQLQCVVTLVEFCCTTAQNSLHDGEHFGQADARRMLYLHMEDQCMQQLREKLLDFLPVAAAEHHKQKALHSVPDEYCDEITSRLMRNPVRLPASQKLVDRSTIERLLLDQSSDPFTRTPLRLDEVLPEPELRDRIAEWRLTTIRTELPRLLRLSDLDPMLLSDENEDE